jgi:hypothetical protein
MEVISLIGDQYINVYHTYIRIYGATKYPHLLPRIVPNKLVIKEVAYQSILHGFNSSSNKGWKKCCSSYPLHIEMYKLSNCNYARMEARAILEFNFSEERFMGHYPNEVISSHSSQIKYMWPYTNEKCEEEQIKSKTISYGEVLESIQQCKTKMRRTMKIETRRVI